MQAYSIKRKLNLLTTAVILSNLLTIVILYIVCLASNSRDTAASNPVKPEKPSVEKLHLQPLADEQQLPLSYRGLSDDQKKAVSIVLFQFN